MRCNRRLLMKIQRCLLLTIILTSLIFVITFVTRQPGIFRSQNYVDLVNLKYANSRQPGAFLASYQLQNESYCTFKYGLPMHFRYDERHLAFSPEMHEKSPYRVLYNVLDADSGSSSNLTVTYVTHVTADFIKYVVEIARAWDGAVSVAAFVPDDDADLVTRRLLQVCQCMPEMAKVSVHYVFPADHPPYVKAPLGMDGESEGGTCEMPADRGGTYRTAHQMPYPVNLARNVARAAARTEHVLVSDVELIPSDQLASRFIQMLRRPAASVQRHQYPSRVFVVPVFEIERYEDIPRTKRQLLQLIKDEKALYFHRYTCSHCQKFPGLESWLQNVPLTNDVKPRAVVKRENPFHRWEPIFIGTKDEPMYSEMLSWEGMQDKMTQMFEMCLKGYRFVILDNAFLVHWPGVKRQTKKLMMSNKWRYPFLLKSTRQYRYIINALANKYPQNLKCV